jgi:hypothetical protein
MSSTRSHRDILKGSKKLMSVRRRYYGTKLTLSRAICARRNLPRASFENLDPIDVSWFVPPAQKTDAWKSTISDYAAGAKDYVDFRNKALELKSKSEVNEWQDSITAFAPYFLGLALAMQFAKVRCKDKIDVVSPPRPGAASNVS